MITATFVKNITGWRGDVRLYKLSEPVNYRIAGSKKAQATDHVLISAVDSPFGSLTFLGSEGGCETYIFPATPGGEAISMLEMPGSFQGGKDHEQAIKNAGWTLIASA